MQNSGDRLQEILGVLESVEGYFVLFGADGEEFVIARREDFGGRAETEAGEKQLSLPTTATIARAVTDAAERLETSTDEVMERVNREIAVVHEEEREAELDDLAIDGARHFTPQIPPPRMPGIKVRFEPLHGDLPPELQE